MTIRIDITESLVDEAAQKFYELMSCSGAVDLTSINDKAEALAHADYILSLIRETVANQILSDARLFDKISAEMMGSE